jgi:hypothetical protein
MNFQVDTVFAVPSVPVEPLAPPPPANETIDLLRQLLQVQKEQLAYHKALLAAHDQGARWRAFVGRWQGEFPELAEGCKQALPHLERCYSQLINELTSKVHEEDEPLDNEYRLQEFLDRFGMRLAQLGTILNLVGPLADAQSANESS